ncbi:MAG: hypothetical protein LQ350_002263 [Teloschistes chrysophthalmus]|nr:MAG: hypothetical protein LQ350_002263 [Niorma chrysophthalma]
MTILLTGGTGKTSLRISSLLSSSKTPHILASRSPPRSPPPPSATENHATHSPFDWHDPSTWETPFSVSEQKITAVYLVAAGLMDPLSVLGPFIEMARGKYGVRRFVLMSASLVEKGGWGLGKVHEVLEGMGERGEVEWCVLRPTTFMENLSEAQHRSTIRDEGKLYSATGDGKLPWVSAEDIAAVAYRALVDEKSHDCDHVILGPELLSYGQLAEILTEVLGKPIAHVNWTEDQVRERFVRIGLNEGYAKLLAGLDTRIKEGAEEKHNDVVEKVTGRKPKTFREFAEEKKLVWS